MTNFSHVVTMLYMPKRVDAYLADYFKGKLSRAELKKAIEIGAITVNQGKIKPSTPLKEGDHIEGVLPEEKREVVVGAENIPLKVIYEDEDILAIDKPVGMVVHPGAGNKKGTLVNALLGRGGPLSNRSGSLRPGIVHRLDKDTSGIILVAKNNTRGVFVQTMNN